MPSRADDDGRTVLRRGDHERVGEVDTPDDVTAVLAEGDGEHLVRGLRGDERDRPAAGGRAGRGGEEERRDEEREREKPAHASDTAEAGPQVPVSYGSPTRGVAQPG